MKKKLKIKFWKAEEALVMQILEQEGLPEEKLEGTVRIVITPSMCKDKIYLRGNSHFGYFDLCCILLETNQDRDSCLDKMTQAITDELFTGKGDLKIGETCKVRYFPNDDWKKKKLIAILPENYHNRFIAQSDDDENDWFCYKYARPLCKRTEPKVEECGEVVTYTWEE